MLKKAALRKIQINPCDQHQEKVSKLDENTKALRSQNTELFARINDLKKDLTNKSSLIDKIAKEKQQIQRDHEVTNKKLKECEVSLVEF